MPKAIFDPINVGDRRPISVRVNPTDGATVKSASYTITRKKDPAGFVWDTGGECDVENRSDGVRISTPDLIEFPTADYYTVRYRLVYFDDQIDNSVYAVVPVVGGANCCC